MEGEAPLRANRHWFQAAVDEAGIRDFRWHDLRHTFASRLAMAGVDLRTIQELMGHKTIQMTCRYAHLTPSHQLAAVERLVSHGRRSKRRSVPLPGFPAYVPAASTDTTTDTIDKSTRRRLTSAVA
jgi:integrase